MTEVIGETPEEVLHAADNRVKDCSDWAVYQQLQYGVRHLEDEVVVLAGAIVVAVGVFQFVPLVFLVAEALILNGPSFASSMVG